MADMIALAVQRVLDEHFIAVPEDVLLIGFDDAFFADYVGLSTIRQDFPTLGRLAVKQALAKLDQTKLYHPAAPQKPELIERRSLGFDKESGGRP